MQDVYCSTSWQGDPLRVPVASPRLLVLQGCEPFRTIKTYRRFITRRKRLRSPPAPPSTNPAWIGCMSSFLPRDHGHHFDCWTSNRGFALCTTTKDRPWMRFLNLASPRPGHCPDPIQPSYPAVFFGEKRKNSI